MSDDPELEEEAIRQRLIDMIESETRLCERLKDCGRGFGQAVTAADKQQNAMAALEAIIEHLNARKATLDCITPLLALAGDIENLCDGNEVDFLIPQRGGAKSRPGKSTIRDTVFAAASALIDHLERLGWDEPKAARRVSDEVEKRGLGQNGFKTTAANQLLTYRTRLNAGLRPANVKKLYEDILDMVASKGAEEAIQFVLDFVGQLGSKTDSKKF